MSKKKLKQLLIRTIKKLILCRFYLKSQIVWMILKPSNVNIKTNSLKHIVTGLKYHKFPNVMCKNIVFRKYTIIRLMYVCYAKCEHLPRKSDEYRSIVSISCLMIAHNANRHKNIRNEYRKQTELRKKPIY